MKKVLLGGAGVAVILGCIAFFSSWSSVLRWADEGYIRSKGAYCEISTGINSTVPRLEVIGLNKAHEGRAIKGDWPNQGRTLYWAPHDPSKCAIDQVVSDSDFNNEGLAYYLTVYDEKVGFAQYEGEKGAYLVLEGGEWQN